MRSDALGFNYQLPNNRYIGEQAPVGVPEQGATPFFHLPKHDQELAYVEGLTDKFYDLRGKIEAYAQDMWKRYGVDVTQPDYTTPGNGGGIPFKTYQKLAAQLELTANDLATSMKEQTGLQNAYASGQIRSIEGFDQTAQPINRMSPGEQFFSTKLLPEIEQANDILRTQVHTEADYNRAKTQVIDPLVKRLTAEMNRPGISQSEREYLQYNINALVQQPKTTPDAYFQDYGNGRKNTVEIDILKKITNLSQGRWQPGTYTESVDDDGNVMLVNKGLEGIQAGEHVYDDPKTGVQKRVPRVISGIEKKEDGVYFTFKQDAFAIPSVKVSSKSGDEVTKDIIESNPKFGNAAKMYEAMRELGYADESGSLAEGALLADEKEFGTPEISTLKTDVEEEKKRIKDLITNTSSPNWINTNKSKIEFSLPDGNIVKFFKHRMGDGWYANVNGEDVEGQEHLDDQDIIRYLAQNKYFDKFLPSNKAKAQTHTQLILTPGIEPLPGENQAAYDLRVIRSRRNK